MQGSARGTRGLCWSAGGKRSTSLEGIGSRNDGEGVPG